MGKPTGEGIDEEPNKARDQLVDELRNAEGGASIRSLVATTGRSYGSIHAMLRESGATMRSRGGTQPSQAHPRDELSKRKRLPLPHGILDEVRARRPLLVLTGGQPGDQAVEHQVQIALQHVTGHVVAKPPGLFLPPQPITGRGRQLRGAPAQPRWNSGSLRSLRAISNLWPASRIGRVRRACHA
jgi:hypothetical protein